MTTGASGPRYSVTVRREFIAQHFLVGGDWGRENDLNSHHYRIEARYEGTSLDRFGYLVDIEVINSRFDGLVDRYCDRTLNHFPEFEGLNPSVENFARILSERLTLSVLNVDCIEVTVWEDGAAGASYRRWLAKAE